MIKFFYFKRFLTLSVIIILILHFFTKKSYSVEPEEFLSNPSQELRARNISKNIRCLVCQNQSIDESSALLAKDLRIIIRKKIKENFTDDEIYKYLTDRYGDFILLKPPLNKKTYALWSFPFLLFIIGVFILYWHNKKSAIK